MEDLLDVSSSFFVHPDLKNIKSSGDHLSIPAVDHLRLFLNSSKISSDSLLQQWPQLTDDIKWCLQTLYRFKKIDPQKREFGQSYKTLNELARVLSWD